MITDAWLYETMSEGGNTGGVMANYVWNKVVCRKEILDQYFIDEDPFGENETIEPPYISLNKLFGVKSLNEYSEKYGVHIYYGYSFSWAVLSDGLCEIKFCTRWQYPICAILRTLDLAHDTVWYAVEENHVSVSRFYWFGEVKEDVLYIEDDYDEWLEENNEFDDSLDDPDDGVWYYLPITRCTWRNWESKDGFERYRDVAAVHVDLPEFLERE